MYTLPDIVTPSKTDSQGNMKLFSALQLMQDCSVFSFSQPSPFLDWLQANNATPLVSFRQVDVVRVPRLGEKLTCRTFVFDAMGSFGHRNTAVYDEAGNPCYLSWCIGAFVNVETGRLCRMPQEVRDAASFPPRLEMNYLSRKILPPEATETVLPHIPVQRNDIDYNLHVNNAQYIRMAVECLPPDFEPRTLRVDYKKPVLPGAVIEPALRLAGDVAYICLKVDGIPCCVVEFTR